MSRPVTSWQRIKPAAADCPLIAQIADCTDDLGRRAWFVVLPVRVPRSVAALLDEERPCLVRDVPRARDASGVAQLKAPALVTLLLAGQLRHPILVLRGDDPEILCALASHIDAAAAASLMEQVEAGRMEELDPVHVRVTTTQTLARAIFGKGAA